LVTALNKGGLSMPDYIQGRCSLIAMDAIVTRSVPDWSSTEKSSTEKMPLCYNAVTMPYVYRFANNDNNDNDDLRIVGRSFAG
jgi:hypothetical protein